MPLYEYQCPKCGRFELIQKFAEPPLTACPTCGAPVEKLLSAPAIQFKGTGWYITDYARKGEGKGKGEPKTEGAKSEKPEKSEGTKESAGSTKDSSASSDSKPAAATATAAKDSGGKSS